MIRLMMICGLSAALIGAVALKEPAHAASLQGTAASAIATAAPTSATEAIRWRRGHHHGGGFGLFFGGPYFGPAFYGPSCWWSHRWHRRVCRYY